MISPTNIKMQHLKLLLLKDQCTKQNKWLFNAAGSLIQLHAFVQWIMETHLSDVPQSWSHAFGVKCMWTTEIQREHCFHATTGWMLYTLYTWVSCISAWSGTILFTSTHGRQKHLYRTVSVLSRQKPKDVQ